TRQVAYKVYVTCPVLVPEITGAAGLSGPNRPTAHQRAPPHPAHPPTTAKGPLGALAVEASKQHPRPASMVRSRTGHVGHVRNRRRVLHRAKANGLTHCPGYELRDGTPRPCGRPLDYDTPLQPGSAETDHIIDHQYGGTDDTNNLRVICRTCNLERNRHRPP